MKMYRNLEQEPLKWQNNRKKFGFFFQTINIHIVNVLSSGFYISILVFDFSEKNQKLM